MAEGVLRAQAALWGVGDRVLIDSAGTTRWHESQPPTPEAQVAARERGYFINELRSRPVEASDFDRFDWIIGMTREHQQFLRERRRSHDQAQILLHYGLFNRVPGKSPILFARAGGLRLGP